MGIMKGITLALLIAIGTLVNGCGGTNVQQAPQTTLGQELMDLDKAYKSGIINEKEYNQLKKDIVKKY